MTIVERTTPMRIKLLIVLALVALLAIACGPEMDTSTSEEVVEAPTAAVEEGPTVGPSEEPTADVTADVGEPITTTMPITPTGGVDVALAAIEPVEGALATVNGAEITWDEFEPELHQSLYSVTQQYAVDWNQPENIGLLGAFQDQILQAVIDRTLLRQVAPEEGFDVSPSEVESLVEEQKAAILEGGQFSSWEGYREQMGLSDEYFARLLEDSALVEKVAEAYGPDREVEQVHAAHILVADEETGQEVLDRLNNGEDWSALALEYSQDTGNKEYGGDLGWFPRGQMVAEFEDAAFALEPGETSGLVQSQFGYHIIQVLSKGMHELDEQIYGQMQQQAFVDWLDEKRAAADIAILVTFAAAE
jgi:foldase protein PrsA